MLRSILQGFHKNVQADVPLVGDLKTVLTDLVPMVDEYDHGRMVAQIADWKVEGDGRLDHVLAGGWKIVCGTYGP